MASSDGDLELVGWKFGSTGATAFGLINDESFTGSGKRIREILDSEPGRKDVLLVFGEVDVSDHIGRHGTSVEDSLSLVISRYVKYLREIAGRSDTGLVLVASTIPHSRGFRPEEHEKLRRISELWNESLRTACESEDLVYVDWYSALDAAFGSPLDGNVEDEGESNPGDPQERHLGSSVRPVLIRCIRAALDRLNS